MLFYETMSRSSARPRTRARPRNRLRDADGWELRASVSESTFETVNQEAIALGRSRTWHAGLYIEGLVEAGKLLAPAERAHLDELLRQPEALGQLLRATLEHSPLAKRPSSTVR